MPEICRFYGIVIFMFFDDHMPPHFHAVYGEYAITVGIETGAITGHFPRHALELVLEWSTWHRAELLADWILARERKPLLPIDPLE